jgi:PKD repeat protein
MKRLALLLLFAATVKFASAAPVSVLTYHNDNARTGQNTNETALTRANVNTNSFHLLFTYPVDGYVYAQPLVLANVSIPGNGVHDVVYVVTEHNSVYAFDANSNAGSNAVPLWQVSFINSSAGVTSVPNIDVNCNDLVPEIGITSTPVIDPVGGTIYIVTKTKEVVSGTTNYVHRLHALDVTTGSEKLGGPVVIQATVPGTGYDSDGFGNVSFGGLKHHSRTALLLNNNTVYFGFGAHCDIDFYHGWLFGFDAQTLVTNVIFNSTPNGQRGGIWNTAGAVCDTNGNLYLSIGNGTFDPTNANYGDTLLKLSASNSLEVADYFTPHNQQDMNDHDLDLNSGGVVLLPDEAGSLAHPHLVICAGKEGTLYLVDRDNMGQFNAADDTQIVQPFPDAIGGCFDTPAYFNNTLYYIGVHDVIKAFTITNASIVTIPASLGSTAFGFPGATPSISANGTNDAIVWAIQSDANQSNGPSILHAYNAANVSQELYNSSQAGSRDTLGGAVKFTVPTIANGKAYVGTETGLSVLGNFVTTPTIIPGGGTFTNSVLVTLTNGTPGSAIYYTLNNTVPTTNSLLYTGPFSQGASATVSAKAFLSGGTGSATATAAFTVVSLQPPSASFNGNPTAGPAPLMATFTDTSTGSITNRSWIFGDGGITNTLNTTVIHTYNATGTNTVTLFVAGPLGSDTNILVNYILVTNVPPQQIVSHGNSNFGLVSVGQSSTQTFSVANVGLQILTGSVTVAGTPFALIDGSPYTLSGGQTGLVNVSFNPVAVGAFTGSVVFTSNGGILTNALIGSAAIAPVAGFTANPTNGVAPLLVNFTDASSGTVTGRVWRFGDSGTSAATSPTHAYSTAGVYSVALTVSGPNGSSMTNLMNLITATNVISTLPTVTITRPGNGMLYPPVTNLTITVAATATAHDGGAISKIQYFMDGVKFGETASSPGTNFFFNPTFGNHVIITVAIDTLGATNTSAPIAITVGAKNSPLGIWETTIGGADKGAQFLTFQDDFSASGFGIRLKQFGLENIAGNWSFNAKGQATGPFVEETLNTTNWNGTLLGTIKSLKNANGTVPTVSSGIFHWKGIPATGFRDLSGTWTGAVTVVKTTTPVSYALTPNAKDAAVFDIATSAAPGTVVGQLLITSRNAIYGYITFGGKSVTMSGSFNIKKLTMSLKGTDNTGEKIKLQIVQ